MRRALLLLIALLPIAAGAQEAAVNGRALQPAEAARYRSLEKEIRSRDADDVAGIRFLIDRVRASTLRADAQEALLKILDADIDPNALRLAGRAFAEPRPGAVAIILLYKTNGQWADDDGLREHVRGQVLDETTDMDTRLQLLSLFAFTSHFAEVEETAEAWARDHASAVRAHSAASAIVAAHRVDAASLAVLGRSPIRAVREEAILDARSDAASLLAIAKDSGEPESLRREAIEALGACHASAALLELLEPRYWFSAAAGPHSRMHSLGVIIPILATMPSPESRSALIALRTPVAALRPGERESVEWTLADALGEHRDRAEP